MQEILHGHKARKRFGQNFLKDDYWIEKIASSIQPEPGQNIIEIGPGQAALTRKLIARADHVSCVEIDKDLAAWLRTQFPPEQLTLIEGDALKVDWESFAKTEKMRIVGNLPYNISSPLLFTLANVCDHVIDQHFMLQKEVVDRMCAEPGHKAFGRLSVMLQLKYRMFKLFDVPPDAFTPAPKVISSVVRMIPLRAEERFKVQEVTLSRLITAAFAMRRKTLRNALSRWISPELLEEAGIRPESRAESVSLEQWVALSNIVDKANITIVIPGQSDVAS